jgi:hypothetical protein
MELPKAFPLTTEVWMVPCRVTQKKLFSPINRPLDEANAKSVLNSRNAWQPLEDLTLKKIIKSRGPKNWSSVAKELNKDLHESLPVRIGKQCRERWLNHLDPSLIKTKWTNIEDKLLLKKQKELGNKWSEIAKSLTGRTENQVKNRWKSLKNRVGKKRRLKRQKIVIVKENEEIKSIPSLALTPSSIRLETGSTYSLEDIDNLAITTSDYNREELDFLSDPHEGPSPVRLSSLTSNPEVLGDQIFNFCAIKKTALNLYDLDHLYEHKKPEKSQQDCLNEIFSMTNFQPWSFEDNFSLSFQSNSDKDLKVSNDSNFFSCFDSVNQLGALRKKI